MGIAVDNTHVVFAGDGGVALHDFLQRTDNQRHRCTYLVGNHREEVQTRLAHLLLLLRIQPLYLLLMLMLGTLQTETYIIPDGGTYY